MAVRGKALAPPIAEANCGACLEKNTTHRFLHHHFLDQKNELRDHLIEQYGQVFAADGRLKLRIELVQEAWEIYVYEFPMTPGRKSTPHDLIDAYKLAKERILKANPRRTPEDLG